MNSRAIAAQVLTRVLPLSRRGDFSGRSLNDALPEAYSRYPDSDRGLVQALCFGVCRHYTWLDQVANQLVRQPFKPKDSDLHALLLVGLFQLYQMRIPDHAAISETVEAARQLKKSWAVKVINGMLRRAQREKQDLTRAISPSLAVTWSHPQWLVDMVKTAWPHQVEKILAANNEPAPMTLRVNERHQSRDEFLKLLQSASIPARPGELASTSVQLEQPVDVHDLPGFAEGHCSVQDEAAQLAARILEPRPGDRVLDACAAPGGKTTHLLELQPELAQLTAVDNDSKRVARIRENLIRLGLSAEIRCEDLLAFCDNARQSGTGFDRILLDVPCSATGVIRRHPDIKWLRKRRDIPALANKQLLLLQACWSLLKPRGVLLYTTCSILPQENERVINQFLKTEPTAREEIIVLAEDKQQRLQQVHCSAGRQLLPETGGSDGFYYAKLRKIDPEATQQ
ncbi:MAG: 16S rRNA (cytosine(967)-C(5))-methyltransferase RsmB [Ketobacteraceae bacterium]|nr:16S rRNA (cytosine(967)-C(5))-methyltransferase RsmB [Ketobacteraceae bacterium]